MKTRKLYIGLDVHLNSIHVAVAIAGCREEPRFYGKVGGSNIAVVRALRRIAAKHDVALADLRVCYEAGPTGFALYRHLDALKIQCAVIAPSKIEKASGDVVKTDRRDCLKLARQHRAGDLTEVHVPDARDEAVRDLCRARTDAVQDCRRSRKQLKAFLNRIGFNYTGSSSWSVAHKSYLRELTLPTPE